MENREELTNEEKTLFQAFLETEGGRSLPDNLLNAFNGDTGKLREFKDGIKTYNEGKSKYEKLVALFRGNKIVIYLHNHALLTLSYFSGKKGEKDEKGKISFDYNHARYTSEWKTYLEKLQESHHFELKKRKDPQMLEEHPQIAITKKDGKIDGREVGVISSISWNPKKEEIQGLFKILSGLIEDFFDVSAPQKKIDYFKQAVAEEHPDKYQNTSRKQRLTEKIWQQRIFMEYQKREDGLYIYDLEFSQAFPPSDYVKKYAKENGSQYADITAKSLKEKLQATEPDMLAIRYENSMPKALVLIEVKSKKSSCEGKSGIEKHLRGMKRYSDNDFLIQKRREDAFSIINQFKKIGYTCRQAEEAIKSLPVERLLILTNDVISPKTEFKENGAIAYYKARQERINGWADKYECDIWLIQSNYTEDQLQPPSIRKWKKN